MIYFIQAGENGPIKIGKTGNSIAQRLAQLQTCNPEKLRLIWIQKAGNITEERIHKELETYRIRGEWFEARAVLKYICQELSNNYEIELFNSNCFVNLGESYIDNNSEEICIDVTTDINGNGGSWWARQDMSELTLDLSRSNVGFLNISIPKNIDKNKIRIHRG